MPYDNEGKPAASFSRARFRDSLAAEKKSATGSKGRELPKDSQPAPDATEVESSPEDIKDVVAEHGPASEVHHHEVDGQHHVTSHHGEFKHHSVHGSHAEAHAHMGHAMGVDERKHEEDEEAAEMAPAAGGRGGIPGMS